MGKDEALKLALEALESGVKTTANRISWTEYDTCLMNEAITAIKEALAQPARSEWNAALDEAAARIGEIKGFGQATQDSFAVFIKGLKK